MTMSILLLLLACDGGKVGGADGTAPGDGGTVGDDGGSTTGDDFRR